jgi:hypothetical protein
MSVNPSLQTYTGKPCQRCGCRVRLQTSGLCALCERVKDCARRRTQAAIASVRLAASNFNRVLTNKAAAGAQESAGQAGEDTKEARLTSR